MPIRNSISCEPGALGCPRHVLVECPGAGDQQPILGRDPGQRPTQTDHDAPDAAVAHQEVGAYTHRQHRNLGRQILEEGGEVLGVGRVEKDVGRSTDLQPGQALQRNIAPEFAPYGRELIPPFAHRATSAKACEFCRQSVCPGANRAGAKANDEIARVSGSADRISQPFWTFDRTAVTMAACAYAVDQPVTIGTFDRRFACGVDRCDQNRVGIMEAAAEILEQVGQARVSMRLDHRHDLALGGLARGREDSTNLNRMVPVIVDDGYAADLAGDGEAALDPAKRA